MPGTRKWLVLALTIIARPAVDVRTQAILAVASTASVANETAALAHDLSTSSILGDGCVHFDNHAACNEHLPLSFGASTQSQESDQLTVISSATPHHVTTSN